MPRLILQIKPVELCLKNPQMTAVLHPCASHRHLFCSINIIIITTTTTTTIIIRHELGLKRPVSASANSLFKGLPSRFGL
jgi:hypothetical protein